MPFKIIETIERGRRLITTVPSSWESDGNLYWPRKNVTLLKKNENSTPKTDWKCLPCILLRNNIIDYKTAEQEVILMSDATETDDKENEYQRKNTVVTLNLNNLATECMEINDKAEEASPMVEAEDASSIIEAKNLFSMVAVERASSVTVADSNIPIPSDLNNIFIEDLTQEHTTQPTESPSIQNNILNPDENLPLPNSDQHLNPQLANPQITVTDSIQVPQEIGYFIELATTIQENQKVLFENQQNILKGIALLNTKFEEFFVRSQGPFLQERPEMSSHFKTITDIDELTAFEKQLENPLVETQYFQELSIICSEKRTGHNNAYALVDAMFDRKFMTHCSWGGGTKGAPKHCFKAFTKTIELFLKVVHQYDKTFTKPICEDFFKNIMRHSLKRNIAKRVRTSTEKKKKIKKMKL